MMQAVILNIDAPNRRLVSRRQTASAGCLGELLPRRMKSATWCAAACARGAAFGVFVELAPGVEALCHKSEIPPMPDAGRTGATPRCRVGDEYDFKIIKMNEAEKKIGLSLRAVAEDEERTRLEDYQRQAAAATHDNRRSDEHYVEKGKTGKMTKAELIEEVSRVVEMTRKDSEVIVEAIFDSVVRALRSGDKIEIRGFGSFRTRQRQPRVGRNPKTGARVEVPSKRIPYFKPSKELKDLVNTDSGGAARLTAEGRALPNPWTISGVRGDIATSPRLHPDDECIFCKKASESDDREELHSAAGGAKFRPAESVSVYQRAPDDRAVCACVRRSEDADPRTLEEMMLLAQRAEAASADGLSARRLEYRHEYRPLRRRRRSRTSPYARAAAMVRRR